jgi:hypothetical protein
MFHRIRAIAAVIVPTAGMTVFVAGAPRAAEWKGQEVTENGVLHVKNPETPPEEITVDLKEIWQLGGEDDDTIFGVISQLVEDTAGNVYLLDSQLSEIPVYSPSGERLRTVGREGEGPGEFSNSFDMFLGPDGTLCVVQAFPGKIIRIKTTGDPADNFPLPQAEGGGFQLVFSGQSAKDRVVLAGAQMRQEEGKQLQTMYLKSFDTKGTELVHYTDRTTETRFGGMKFVEEDFTGFQRRWALAPDGRVAVGLEFHAYRIHVWNPDGTLNRVIERDGYAPLARTAGAKDRFQRLYDGVTRWNPGSTFKISDNHEAINQLTFRNDGSLWVLSSCGTWACPEGILASFDVYDRNGRYVRKVSFRGHGDPTEDGLFLRENRLYVVTELLGALMASFGASGGDDASEEVEPMSVIAQGFDPAPLRLE